MNATVDFLIGSDGVAVYFYEHEEHIVEYKLAIWCGWNTKR
jgi:hypothetical protein